MNYHGATLTSLLALACIAGCRGTEETPGTTDPAAPTYYEDIAPIVNNECAGCHDEHGIGGFNLTDPSVAVQLAGSIAAATAARAMPPMPVNNDGSCNTFKNARWLTDEQIQLFQRWSNAGAPLGDPAAAPPPPQDQAPELAGELAEFDLGVDYTPKPRPGEPDDYHCFVVDPEIAADTFVTGFDIQPGNGRIVHHVALFALPNDDAEADAAALDAAEAGPGYTCFGGAGTNRAIQLATWAPGGSATFFPEGTGIRFTAGHRIVLQMHYNVPQTGGPFVDRSRVKLQLNADPTLTPALFAIVLTHQLSLPPGQPLVEATGEIPLSKLNASFNQPDFKGIRVWGVLPHMHTAGHTQRTVAKGPSADQCLTDVDRWEFHWQNQWWNETPLDVKSDSTLSITCGFDTRGRTETTTWGEGTNDEMCVNLLYSTLL